MGRRNQAFVVFQHPITTNEELTSCKRQILKTNVLHPRMTEGLVDIVLWFFFSPPIWRRQQNLPSWVSHFGRIKTWCWPKIPVRGSEFGAIYQNIQDGGSVISCKRSIIHILPHLLVACLINCYQFINWFNSSLIYCYQFINSYQFINWLEEFANKVYDFKVWNWHWS